MAKLTDKELAANYGWALATLNSDKGLKALFQRAVSKQLTPQRFVAELRNLPWFKTKSESARKYIILKTADPAEYKNQVAKLRSHITDVYGKATGTGLGNTLAGTLTNLALMEGWSDEQLNDHITDSVDWTKLLVENRIGGAGAQIAQAARAQGLAQGVRLSDRWLAQSVEAVIDGNNTVEGVQEQINEIAKSHYPAFASQIDGGQTLSQLTEGYKQSAATVLELNPNQVDVFDSNIQKAIGNTNAAGAPVPLNLNQFEDMLRQDDRWQYTKNAKESLLGAGQGVLKSFGLVS